jgi:hypothetical protein
LVLLPPPEWLHTKRKPGQITTYVMSNNGSSKEEANLKQNRSPKTIEKS